MDLLLLDALSETVSSALEINVYQMLVQILATAVLVVVVRVFFWSKITAFLEKRREVFNQEIDQAKKQNEEAKVLKEQAIEERQEILKRSKEMIDNAKAQGETEKNKIIDDAKNEAKRIIDTKSQEFEHEMSKARLELKHEAIDLAVEMAEKIIATEIDSKKYQDQAISDLERSEKA